ncbi:hypothetical protein [Sphingobium terrigena]|nr:hypothetical protein [Sphingobium terrigena]
MVESATKACQPMISLPPEQANPNWDAMAASLASQANAIAWGSLVLAVIVIIAGIAWGKIITANAEHEARAMAKACADEYIKEWLSKEAPGIIRERVDLIADATLGSGNDADAADEIGREA